MKQKKTTTKKSVLIFGLKKNNVTQTKKEEKDELKSVKDLFENSNIEERQNLEDEVEKIPRMGLYGGIIRVMKVLLNTQKATEDTEHQK